MKKLTTLCILFALVVGLVLAAEPNIDGKKAERAVQQERVRAVQEEIQRQRRTGRPEGSGQRGSINREQMFKQYQARLAEQHAKAIAEIEAIKKIAEEEGATKTMAALQAMIDKKNVNFKQAATRSEQQMRQRMGRGPQQGAGQPMPRPTQDRPGKRIEAPVKAPETAVEEK